MHQQVRWHKDIKACGWVMSSEWITTHMGLTWVPKANGNRVDHARLGVGLLKRSWKKSLKNMGSTGLNSLEAENIRSNSPLGERINDDEVPQFYSLWHSVE